MKLPSSFNCAGFTIKVEIVDKLPDNEYGDFEDVTNVIKLAKSVEVDNDTIQLTAAQMLNTFFHEVCHCFQFYFNNSYDEAQAQVYANFIQEFIRTKDM